MQVGSAAKDLDGESDVKAVVSVGAPSPPVDGAPPPNAPPNNTIMMPVITTNATPKLARRSLIIWPMVETSV